jgi:hypothetical protein
MKVLVVQVCCLLRVTFLLGLLLKPEDGDMYMKPSVDFQRITRRYIKRNKTLHNHSCENLRSYKNNGLLRIPVRNRPAVVCSTLLARLLWPIILSAIGHTFLPLKNKMFTAWNWFTIRRQLFQSNLNNDMKLEVIQRHLRSFSETSGKMQQTKNEIKYNFKLPGAIFSFEQWRLTESVLQGVNSLHGWPDATYTRKHREMQWNIHALCDIGTRDLRASTI